MESQNSMSVGGKGESVGGNNDDDINALSDNKVSVDIEPDVKSNVVPIQICSCSFSLVFHCFTRNDK
jgi:hypothetical protein